MPTVQVALLVWRCASLPSAFVNEVDGVDGTQVVIVLLDDVAGVRVPLVDLQGRAGRQRGEMSMRVLVNQHREGGCVTFLSPQPAMSTFCLSGSGCSRSV